jgi:hypothetical protein
LDLYVFKLVYKVGIKLIIICLALLAKNITIFLRDALANRSIHSDLCTLVPLYKVPLVWVRNKVAARNV